VALSQSLRCSGQVLVEKSRAGWEQAPQILVHDLQVGYMRTATDLLLAVLKRVGVGV
jgi:hypothetical protein